MTYILAEIASAHMGDPDLCLELIQKAKEAGADGVKVQVWYPDEGDFSHMLDKRMTKLQHEYYLKNARGVEVWGQYYGDRSLAVAAEYCLKTINGWDKPGFIGRQLYPTPISVLGLDRLRLSTYDSYADHSASFTDAVTASMMAISLGAKTIEKHICLDREELKKKSKDWCSALEPDEFKQFVNDIRRYEKAL